jgi:hypothetical protein
MSLTTGHPESLMGADAVLALAGLSDGIYDAVANNELFRAPGGGDIGRAR